MTNHASANTLEQPITVSDTAQDVTVDEKRLEVRGNADILALTHGQNTIFFDRKTADWFLGIIDSWKDTFHAR